MAYAKQPLQKGQRYIADVKIRDEYGPDKVCECSFTVFLPKAPSSQSALEALVESAKAKTPVTFFALQCDVQGTSRSVKPDWDRFRWAPCSSGARAEALTTNVNNVLGLNGAVTIVNAIVVCERKDDDYYYSYY